MLRSHVTVYLPWSLSCANYWNKLNKWHSNWGSSLNPYRLWITIILNITYLIIRFLKGMDTNLRVNLSLFVKNNSTSGIMAMIPSCENLQKLASTSMGKNYWELARRPLHHFRMCGILFFILCKPHENICCMNFAHGVWNPQMKTNHMYKNSPSLLVGHIWRVFYTTRAKRLPKMAMWFYTVCCWFFCQIKHVFPCRKKYTSGPRYWNVPVLVDTGTFHVYQYCPEMWYLRSLERAGCIQKQTILETPKWSSIVQYSCTSI